MDCASLVLEYVRIILSGPVLLSFIVLVLLLLYKGDIRALLSRIATIKLPGGAELSTIQRPEVPMGKQDASNPEVVSRLPDVPMDEGKQDASNPEVVYRLSDELPADLRAGIESVIEKLRLSATIWEYRFLTLHFVPNTHRVLDWLIELNSPTPHELYETVWLPLIPSSEQREVILQVLTDHDIIWRGESGLIEVTSKGKHYHEARGRYPLSTQ